jgi:hypothetical protein
MQMLQKEQTQNRMATLSQAWHKVEIMSGRRARRNL